ncbi:hypothetical protein SASPL_120556 [Salvia splendens]|uniref:2-oxoacid dehydrogenase acyltransferase catalytic domain-containing protein n=1 Tax=Salvia splendens TaxID=180675 RepID=A0A8X8XUU0_SALSN|nr:hypothetical protein SASPL_120556 [Salvia splendens]
MTSYFFVLTLQLRHTHHAIQKDRAFLVCWFTHHARMDANHIDANRGTSSDIILRIQDKASVEMECMEEGYLAKIVLGDGSTGIKVGEIIAVTVEEEEDLDKFKDYSPSISDAAASSKETLHHQLQPKKRVPKWRQPSPQSDHQQGAVFSLALSQVHISNTKGTSHDGRVTKIDIKDSPASGGKEVSPALDYVDMPQTQIGKVTASRLLQSKQTIPHYYLTVDTCVDKLMELHIHLNSLQEASGGRRISVNDLVIKAAAMALREVPQCNSSWTDDYIRQYRNVNINIAVQTDNGLCVPVIKDADKKGLSRIGKEVKHLAEKARENSLKPEDYEGGTFTVSNLGGSFGVEQFRAIVNPPQAGILAVGSAQRRVIPGSGRKQYEFALFMTATLSCDHRVVDGATGAEWLKAYKGYIENPQSMLV